MAWEGSKMDKLKVEGGDDEEDTNDDVESDETTGRLI